ncbi:LuxR C-terminal-related transcriptional regulator [Sphingopyxis panaciterrae]
MGSVRPTGSGEPSSCAVVAVHQPLIRRGLRDLVPHAGLEAHSEEILDFESLLAMLGRIPILALVILCLALPGMNGMQGIQRLRGRFPSQPMLVIVEHTRRETIMDLISAGADGVVPLSTESDAIVRAMVAVSSGDMYVPRFLPDEAAVAGNDTVPTITPAASSSMASLNGLTDRQREVLQWMAIGESNKTIGRRLNISPHTVNMHVRAVFRALGVHCRIEAVNKLAAHSLDSGFRVVEGMRRTDGRNRSPRADNDLALDEPSFNFS